MRIHSRCTLNEGLGFDTRSAYAGLGRVRNAMSGLLSPEGENAAKAAVNPVAPVTPNTKLRFGGFYEISFKMATDQTGIANPINGKSLIVDRQIMRFGTMGQNLIGFSDGNTKEFVLEITGMAASYPVINQAYQVKIKTNTLFLNAPPVPLDWLEVSSMVPKRNHNNTHAPVATTGPGSASAPAAPASGAANTTGNPSTTLASISQTGS